MWQFFPLLQRWPSYNHFSQYIFKIQLSAIKKTSPGNTHCTGRLSTVDLLIKVLCFCSKANNVGNINSILSKPIITRRSTVLSLPLQKGFPDFSFIFPHYLIGLWRNKTRGISSSWFFANEGCLLTRLSMAFKICSNSLAITGSMSSIVVEMPKLMSPRPKNSDDTITSVWSQRY